MFDSSSAMNNCDGERLRDVTGSWVTGFGKAGRGVAGCAEFVIRIDKAIWVGWCGGLE
jgi:hypothetical protein